MDNNICPGKSMGDWVRNGDNEEMCRPCLLPIVLSWYKEELAENNKLDMVESLESIIKKGDPEKVCDHLDYIKGKADPGLKERLLEYDCHLQVNAEYMYYE